MITRTYDIPNLERNEKVLIKTIFIGLRIIIAIKT